jgi:hypothetical protein
VVGIDGAALGKGRREEHLLFSRRSARNSSLGTRGEQTRRYSFGLGPKDWVAVFGGPMNEAQCCRAYVANISLHIPCIWAFPAWLSLLCVGLFRYSSWASARLHPATIPCDSIQLAIACIWASVTLGHNIPFPPFFIIFSYLLAGSPANALAIPKLGACTPLYGLVDCCACQLGFSRLCRPIFPHRHATPPSAPSARTNQIFGGQGVIILTCRCSADGAHIAELATRPKGHRQTESPDRLFRSGQGSVANTVRELGPQCRDVSREFGWSFISILAR